MQIAEPWRSTLCLFPLTLNGISFRNPKNGCSLGCATLNGRIGRGRSLIAIIKLVSIPSMLVSSGTYGVIGRYRSACASIQEKGGVTPSCRSAITFRRHKQFHNWSDAYFFPIHYARKAKGRHSARG